MQLLHIIANPKPPEEAASKQVTEAFFTTLRAEHPAVEVVSVDLYQDPPPFYDYLTYRHFWYPVFQSGYLPSAEERTAAAYALRHGALVNDADVVVVTSPMWNFAVPGILKAWMDQVMSPGLTFTIGPNGTQPLHHLQRVVLLAASGGAYPDDSPKDNFTRQVRTAFGFIGVPEVQVAWADGQNRFFFTDTDARTAHALETARVLAAGLVPVGAGRPS